MVERTWSEMLDGVGAWQSQDRDCHRVVVVEERTQTVSGGGDLHAGHVFQASVTTPSAVTLDDHLAELLRVADAPLHVDGHLDLHALLVGRPADYPGGLACTFWLRMAATTSSAVRPRSATRSGLSHTRIA